jgi:hypothetical protein
MENQIFRSPSILYLGVSMLSIHCVAYNGGVAKLYKFFH